MTDMIVIGFFKLIHYAAFGFLFFLVTVLPIYLIFIMPIIDWHTARKIDQKWLAWATIEQYWETHAECKTRDGTKCYHCNSRNIKQYGYESSADTKRYHKCNQCNMVLYRTGEVSKS